MTPAVLIEDLTHRFADHVAVSQLSLRVEVGEVFGLLGPNGAGKTTAIRLATTLLPVHSGRIEIFGVDVAREPMAVRRRLGYVPQQLSADAALTGRENVTLSARLFDVPRRDRARTVAEILDLVGLSDAADRLAATYSGGMVRRLELAQALVNRPRLLVLDEPTIGLDPVARDSVWERISQLVDQDGMTVLVTTHYMEEADMHCDRVALVHRGQIQASGAPHALREQLGAGATLEDVFRHYTGDRLDSTEGFDAVRAVRRSAGRHA